MSSANERENFVMENFEKECVICNYSVYKEIWEAAIGEELDCQWELSNTCSRSICCGSHEERQSCWLFTEEDVTHLLTVHQMLAITTFASLITDEGTL